jgi:hypothetical protein
LRGDGRWIRFRRVCAQGELLALGRPRHASMGRYGGTARRQGR